MKIKPFAFYKSKLITILICLIPYMILFALSKHICPDVYLFKWMYKESYMWLWITTPLISLFSSKWGYFTSYSFFFCVLFGEIHGYYIKIHNMARITPDMYIGKVYQLRTQYGVFICVGMFIILIFLYALYNVATKIREDIKNQQSI